MSDDSTASRRTIVVGILPDQPLWVVQVAADYARAFDAELVCVAADATRYAYQELPDGSLLTAPIDPDLASVGPMFSEDRLEEIRTVLAPSGVPWSMRELVGLAADALMEVAEQEDALMIVVGARPGGFRGALRHAFTGSVALRLAHRQYRPVVVVPTAPAESDAALLAGLG
ncbi:universal stress protein [Amnibacterium kyonggiense]|uniref:Nucleotide-binding universal stress UspA family protein n=1 Tax=Amnibacterium kyonggiense TaxID=595671 RepID=A0A4R7FLL1_9MICO|nr:universal stress protein [Amnibacterium kyonggiense]TDS77312.1 nucleotide-binding universal stress UspA family protein [Amnibacterium kyonggiense]